MATERTWEYQVLDLNAERQPCPVAILNRQGADGWELVDVDGSVFFFKRPTGEREIPQDRGEHK